MDTLERGMTSYFYLKHNEVMVPALEDWEKQWGKAEG